MEMPIGLKEPSPFPCDNVVAPRHTSDRKDSQISCHHDLGRRLVRDSPNVPSADGRQQPKSAKSRPILTQE